MKEILRTVTPTTSTLICRQIEAMQIGELSLERRNLIAMKEMCEDSDEERGLEQSIAARTKPIEELKAYVKKQDQKATVVKLDSSNWLSHTGTIKGTTEPGKLVYHIPLHGARKRDAAVQRSSDSRVAERAQQRRDLEEQWKAEHMSGKRKYSDYTRLMTTA